MRDVLSEYGMLVLALIGGVFAFSFYISARDSYKEFSVRFIGSITGTNMSYGSDLTLEQIEGGAF